MRNPPRFLRAEGEPASMVLTADVQLQAAAGDKSGTFSIEAYNGGSMRPGGFYRPVVVDLAGLRAGAGGRVAVLLDHDPAQIVGQGIATISAKSVKVDGKITGDDEPAKKVTMHAKGGFVWSASIGVAVDKLEAIGEGQTVKVNGQEFTGPCYVVRAGRLGEVSFVAVGADETASASVAASFSKENAMTFEQWLKARGLTLDSLSDVQAAAYKVVFQAELKAGMLEAPKPAEKPVTDPGKPADPPTVTANATIDVAAQIAEGRKQLAAEAARVAGIQKISKDLPDLQAKAINEGWSVEKTELEVLRASRPKAPGVIIHGGEPATAELLTAAACMSGRLPGVEKQFKPEVLEASARRWRHGISLQELLLEAAWANGYSGHSFRQDPTGVLRAAFSSGDISGILSNIANKFLLDGYMFVEQTWRVVAAIRSVNDFKTVTSYRLTGDAQFEQVAPDGELKHGTLGNDSFTNKADTYGKLFGISRQDLINDDLGALTRVPQRLGRGGGLGLNHVFWTAFLNNAAFFVAGNNNLCTGNPLTLANVDTAVQKFRDQTDQEGKPLGVTPRTMLVPTALEAKAKNIYASTDLRDSTASTKTGTTNVWAGQFTPAVSAYLSNSAYTGYSASSWYLLADPRDVATIEIAFLNGRDTPIVETAEADFNILGIQMRGFFDFGCTKQDPRGGVKCNA